MLFSTLTFSQMSLALAVRYEKDSFFSIGPFSNRILLGAVLLSSLLQLAVVYLPLLQPIFRTQALSAIELAVTLAASTVVFWAVELKKYAFRRMEPHAVARATP
jgi:Ca2+-transporting ATPase